MRRMAFLFGFGSACGADPKPFELSFEPTADGAPVDCANPIDGLGPDNSVAIGMSDLRFYVSDLELRDADGAALEVTLDDNEFQYEGETGWVGLVDLTDSVTGACGGSAIAYSEGTARTNDSITGTVVVDHVASVSFDVGVPQALMREVIGSTTAEAAPSPLNELHWSWAGGYRHFVFNFTVSDGAENGEGYVHVGSTDCAGKGELALQARNECGFVNTPHVELADFDPRSAIIGVDVAALLAGVDFRSPVYDPKTFEVIGEAPGVECHSSPDQPDCALVFANTGIDLLDG